MLIPLSAHGCVFVHPSRLQCRYAIYLYRIVQLIYLPYLHSISQLHIPTQPNYINRYAPHPPFI